MKNKLLLILFVISLLSITSAFSAITDGLKAYYTFDSNVVDSLGLKNGTVTSPPQAYVTGKISNATNFKNSTTYIKTATPFDTSTSNAFSFWIKHNVSVVNSYWDVYDTAGQTTGRMWIQTNRNAVGDISIVSYTGSYQVVYSNASNLADNNWHHVVINRNAGTVTFYVDNVLRATTGTLTTGAFNTADRYFGEEQALCSNCWFNGSLDEFGIWNRTLNTTEISTLYNSGSGLTYPFTTSSNSCTYSGSGAWTIQISDNCILNTNTAVSAPLIVNGTNGTLTINASITAKNISLTPSTLNQNNFIVRLINRVGVMFAPVK